MIKLTKSELYKLERTQKAKEGELYQVDNDLYEGNPYGRVRFIQKIDTVVTKSIKINGQVANKDITIPLEDDSSNYVVSEFLSGEPLNSPTLMVLIGGSVFTFDYTDSSHYGKVIGVNLNSVSNAGEKVIVALSGEVETGTNLFVAGNIYFGGASGFLTDTPPTTGILQLIATAVTNTKIIIDIQQPIIQL